jgi:hypothetical protein
MLLIYVQLLLLRSFRLLGTRELLGLHLLEIVGLSEIDFDICLDDTDLVVRFAVNDINQIVLPAMMNVDRVTLHQARVVGELVLQDGFRVSQVNEGGLVRL